MKKVRQFEVKKVIKNKARLNIDAIIAIKDAAKNGESNLIETN